MRTPSASSQKAPRGGRGGECCTRSCHITLHSSQALPSSPHNFCGIFVVADTACLSLLLRFLLLLLIVQKFPAAEYLSLFFFSSLFLLRNFCFWHSTRERESKVGEYTDQLTLAALLLSRSEAKGGNRGGKINDGCRRRRRRQRSSEGGRE